MYCSETYTWFKAKKIPFPDNYSLEKNRESLQTIFTFSDLKTYGGANIDAIYQRLIKAKEAFSIYNVEANRYYPEILDQFIDGTYQINGFPLFDLATPEIEASDDEMPTTWTDLSDILGEVSTYIRNSNPTWFKEHDDLS